MIDRVKQPTVRELLARRDQYVQELVQHATSVAFNKRSPTALEQHAELVQENIKTIDFLLGADDERSDR